MRNRKSDGAGLSDSERAADLNVAEAADTPGAFITKRIHDMFCEVAEKASSMELTEDESAGVPMTLFAAENYLLNCWKAHIQDSVQQVGEVHLPNCPVYPQWPWPPYHTAG